MKLVIECLQKELERQNLLIATNATKKDAIESIVKPKSKTNKPIPLRAYECPYCSGWHLTSKLDRRFNNEGQE